ncbi:MAG: ATP-binding protein [Brevinematales bacterium]|jgi:PAS domain-containing protein/anti-sigma regulatory factor (Ser/Thr protein kinase)
MNFTYQMGIITFLLPPICFGVLMGGFLLFAYMYLQYKNNIYLAMALLGLLCMLFTLSETLILVYGGLLHDAATGRQFDRIEHCLGAFFLFVYPYYLSYLLELNGKWQKTNRKISFGLLIVALAIIALAYIYPSGLKSQTVPVATALTVEGDFGRGSPGPILFIRDIFIGVMIIYSMICFITDLVWHKKFSYLVFALAGIIICIYSSVDDILYIYTRVNYDPLSHFLFSRFSLGLTFLSTLSMAGLTRVFVGSMKEAEKASKIISLSEKKYRLIVEGSSDFIFSIDSNLQIISANESMEKLLNLKSGKGPVSLKFMDLIYESREDKGLTQAIIKSNLDILLKEKKPFDQKVLFKPFTSDEPKEFRVRLKYIKIDEEYEIVGRATSIVDDILLDCFHSEEQKYIIGNYLITADEMSKRLVRNLNRYMKSQEVNYLRVCLREIIINAIEHGNLAITFEEKTEAMKNENYMEYIMKKQEDPRYKDKKVMIEYSINPDRAVYKIADEGNGFNYRSILAGVKDKESNKFLPHGRGITMTMGIFDSIEYNKAGNLVTLVKNF